MNISSVLLVIILIGGATKAFCGEVSTGTTANEKCEICKTSAGILSNITESKWLNPAERKSFLKSDTHLQTQSGKQLVASEIFNKPTALTFLYTRCDNPNKCPLVAATMAKLHLALRDAGIEENIRLCVMTYDPEYDTADVLTKYASLNGLHPNDNLLLLRPELSDRKDLFESLNVTVNYSAKGVSIHGIQILLLDSKCRLAKSYHTLIWDNKKVIDDLKSLIQETKDEAKSALK